MIKNKTNSLKYFIVNNEYKIYEKISTEENDKIFKVDGNYFNNEKEAQKEIEKRLRINLTYQNLKEIAKKLNKEMKDEIDWNDKEQIKYSLEFNYQTNEIEQDSTLTHQKGNTVYCLSSFFKDETINRIGKRELIFYLTDSEIDTLN